MSNQKVLNYSFNPITHCEMCGDDAANHRILGQRLNKSQGIRPKSKSGISVSIKRCKNCELVYSDPQPKPQSIQDHYGIPPEEYWEKEYFVLAKDYSLTVINKAKEYLKFQPGMKALDIGSGIGKGLIALGNSGFDAYGLEPSETFYEKSMELAKIAPEKLSLSAVEDAKFEDNYFDFIMVNAVFEHVYTPAASIANALKWLKPTGVLYIGVPSANYFITDLIDFYNRLIGTTYTSHLSPMHEPFHLFEFSLKTFQENLKRSNYTILEHTFNVCNTPFFPKVLHPLLNKYMQMTNKGMDITLWIKKSSM
jgi:SAM-dependent methyltransferase